MSQRIRNIRTPIPVPKPMPNATSIAGLHQIIANMAIPDPSKILSVLWHPAIISCTQFVLGVLVSTSRLKVKLNTISIPVNIFSTAFLATPFEIENCKICADSSYLFIYRLLFYLFPLPMPTAWGSHSKWIRRDNSLKLSSIPVVQ